MRITFVPLLLCSLLAACQGLKEARFQFENSGLKLNKDRLSLPLQTSALIQQLGRADKEVIEGETIVHIYEQKGISFEEVTSSGEVRRLTVHYHDAPGPLIPAQPFDGKFIFHDLRLSGEDSFSAQWDAIKAKGGKAVYYYRDFQLVISFFGNDEDQLAHIHIQCRTLE